MRSGSLKQSIANTLLAALFLGGMMACYPYLVMPGWERVLRAELCPSLKKGYFPSSVSTSAYTRLYLVSEALGRAVDQRPREELLRVLLAIDAEEHRRGYAYLIETCLIINKIGSPSMKSYATVNDGRTPERRIPLLQYTDSSVPTGSRHRVEAVSYTFRAYSFTGAAFSQGLPLRAGEDDQSMKLIGR